MPVQQSSTKREAENATRSVRALVVEDDADQRSAICEVLVAHGYHVDAAADGLEAAELAFSRTYDVVVSDIRLPGMSGVDLARLVGFIPMPPAVLLITAYPEWYEEARVYPDLRVLRKPIRLLGLAKEVGEIVSRRAAGGAS